MKKSRSGGGQRREQVSYRSILSLLKIEEGSHTCHSLGQVLEFQYNQTTRFRRVSRRIPNPPLINLTPDHPQGGEHAPITQRTAGTVGLRKSRGTLYKKCLNKYANKNYITNSNEECCQLNTEIV